MKNIKVSEKLSSLINVSNGTVTLKESVYSFQFIRDLCGEITRQTTTELDADIKAGAALVEEKALVDKVKIKVYVEDGRVFKYFVVDATKAREHAHRIVNYGWRTSENDDLVYYPIHQINKVVVVGGHGEAYFKYPTTTEELE